METKVKKWGNSLGIRLPASLAKHIKITDGSTVKLTMKKNSIEIVPVKPAKFSLDEMLNKVTGSNMHGEIDTGKAEGKEIW